MWRRWGRRTGEADCEIPETLRDSPQGVSVALYIPGQPSRIHPIARWPIYRGRQRSRLNL